VAIFIQAEELLGDGDAKVRGYDNGNWFVAESFSFGVERELRESGEHGGTEDINIGVGELQECSISKSLDRTSPKLAQFAINGNSIGPTQIDFVENAGAKPFVYLRYKLDRCFVKSWSTSGDADDRPTEEVAFYYNRIAFTYAGASHVASWDRTRNTPWLNHQLDPLPPRPR
jgi:type VI secretion system secreted protein Hcp